MVLRWMLQNWLRQQAQQRVREAVAQASREATEDPAQHSGQKPTPREHACDVGVVAAMSIELGGLEDLLEGVLATRGHGFVVKQGAWRGRRLAMIESGIGQQAASRAVEAMLLGHRPAWIISTGFAGGLDPALARHDLLLADRIVNAQGAIADLQHPFSDEWMAKTKRVLNRQVQQGPLLTVDEIVRRPEDKYALGKRHGALAVDMETSAVAEICRREGVPFVSARIIGDTVDEELPPEVENLVRQKSSAARAGAAAGAIFRRPSSLKDMWKLKEDALVSSDILARFVLRIVAALVPRPP